MNHPDAQFDALTVITTQRQQIDQLNWQITLLTAQLAQHQAAAMNTAPTDGGDPVATAE